MCLCVCLYLFSKNITIIVKNQAVDSFDFVFSKSFIFLLCLKMILTHTGAYWLSDYRSLFPCLLACRLTHIQSVFCIDTKLSLRWEIIELCWWRVLDPFLSFIFKLWLPRLSRQIFGELSWGFCCCGETPYSWQFL